jgi:hypothetical protein
MNPGKRVQLPVNRKSGSYLGLSKALLGVWKGTHTLPAGMVVEQRTASLLEVGVKRSAFVLEYDALAILTLHPIDFTESFLVPPQLVSALVLRRDSQTLEVYAICRRVTLVTLKEARRLSQKQGLPPGIHSEKALRSTQSPKLVRGGLPSLGKKR